MSKTKRLQNEREFDEWIETEEGGINYSFEIAGKHGWKAKNIKEVDVEKTTIKF